MRARARVSRNFMPGQQESLKLLGILLRLFPELLQIETRGKLVPLNNVKVSSEEELARELNPKYKIKPRERGGKDSSEVIKLSDAVECVVDSLNQKGIVWELVKAAARDLVAGKSEFLPGDKLKDTLIDCLRENVMRQDTVRNSDRHTHTGRPARGHGYGGTHRF
jgi:hypothetical protein